MLHDSMCLDENTYAFLLSASGSISYGFFHETFLIKTETYGIVSTEKLILNAFDSLTLEFVFFSLINDS